MRYLFLSFLIFLVFLRILIFFLSRTSYPDGTILRITESVSGEPIRYSSSQYLRLSGFKVYLPLYPEIFYGDMVIIEGRVEGDKIKNPRLLTIQRNNGLLLNLRQNLLGFYQKSLPNPHSGLVAGIAIGSKAGLGEDFWQHLKNTGTAHVVVASGMNVTLVSRFLISLLTLFLARKKALPLAISGIWGYSLMSGFDAPIIRAAIMGTLAFTAQEVGRLYHASYALILSAMAMLLIKPEWILDLGFILSFVATASLMLFERKVNRLILFIPNVIREGFSTSLAAQIGVAPILFFSFGSFNLFSPLVNALVLWTIPIITVVGILAGIIGIIFEPLGKLILLLVFPLTTWFIGIVRMF